MFNISRCIVVVNFLLVTWMVCESSCCSCQRLDNFERKSFQTADYVLRLNITSERQTGTINTTYHGMVFLDEVAFYKVQIANVYKMKYNISELLETGITRDGTLYTTIFTSVYGSMCGVSFDVGCDYLIAGYVTDKRLYVSLCNWLTKWKYMTSEMVQGVQGSYNMAKKLARPNLFHLVVLIYTLWCFLS